jgi:hypothetical protein
MKMLRLKRGRVRPASAPRLTAEWVRNELDKASFAVISYLTPAGKPRGSVRRCG